MSGVSTTWLRAGLRGCMGKDRYSSKKEKPNCSLLRMGERHCVLRFHLSTQPKKKQIHAWSFTANTVKEQGCDHVQIKSPNSDIFFILLHYAHLTPDITLLFHTGRGNKQRLKDVTNFAQHSLDYMLSQAVTPQAHLKEPAKSSQSNCCTNATNLSNLWQDLVNRGTVPEELLSTWI